jgi:hypothetical protein
MALIEHFHPTPHPIITEKVVIAALAGITVRPEELSLPRSRVCSPKNDHYKVDRGTGCWYRQLNGQQKFDSLLKA